MKYSMEIIQLGICENMLFIAVKGRISQCDADVKPKLLLWFENGKEDRNFTMRSLEVLYTSDGDCEIKCAFYCTLDYVFWKTQGKKLPFSMHFDLICGEHCERNLSFDLTPDHCLRQRGLYDFTVKNRQEIVFTPAEHEEAEKAVNKNPIAQMAVRIGLLFCVIVTIPFGLIELFLSLFHVVPFNRKRKKVYLKRERRQPLLFSDAFFLKSDKLLIRTKEFLLRIFYYGFSKLPGKKDAVTFISQRSEQIEGNFQFVHEQLKVKKDVKIKTFLSTKIKPQMTYWDMLRFSFICASSKVILVDEYVPVIYTIKLKGRTKLIQLWHACGAFKTFGFSRIGMPGAPRQSSHVHRGYDYVTVSSKNIAHWYAQGFGLSMKSIIPTGVPRTDVFVDTAYGEAMKKTLYSQYPNLKDKKIILFAPTFRGAGKETAFYPVEQFDVERIYKSLGSDYAILIKQHPFVKDTVSIPDHLADCVLDMSDYSDINALLFITDIVITDYSSLIFEASLLNLPMLFYVFDLQEYTAERDFYFDFGPTVPGKKVFSQDALIQAIQQEDFEHEKVAPFRDKYFEELDGKSTERVVDLVVKQLGS